jgi:hypothetical protein
MGQILGIGIITKCNVSKKKLREHDITKDELIAKMMSDIHFEPTIYDLEETEEFYFFTLKSSVIETQLLSFLEKFYPLVYSGQDDFEDTLKKLKESEPNTWLELAERKHSEVFQLDVYGMPMYLYFDKSFNPRVVVDQKAILLSLEGTMMEEYGRQFNFLRYCMQQAFPEFSIAKALNVYISG